MFVVAGGYVRGKDGRPQPRRHVGRQQRSRPDDAHAGPDVGAVAVRAGASDAAARGRSRGCCRPTRRARTSCSRRRTSSRARPIRSIRWATSQDVAIGLSRTFLDLVGFHVYNSGTLCLDIGGSARAAAQRRHARRSSSARSATSSRIARRRSTLVLASADAADVHRRRGRHGRSAHPHRHQRHAHRLLRLDRGALRAPLDHGASTSTSASTSPSPKTRT